MTESGADGDTNEAIMWATYRALSKHGYPQTTIAKIADEFKKSKSLLYYHYEDKERLLEDFLRFLLDQFESNLADLEQLDPYEHLVGVIDPALPDVANGDHFRFLRVILEIRSQAPYHDVYREQFERSDELILSELTAALERGIESGEFRPVNTKREAEFIYSTAMGAVERGVTLEDPEILEAGRDLILEHVDSKIRRHQ